MVLCRGLLHRLEYYLLRIKQSLTAQDSTLVLTLLFTATPLNCFLKFFRLYLDATCHQKAGPCEQFVSFICMYLLGTLQLEHMQLSITSRLHDAQELLCDLLPTHVVQLLLAAGAAKRQREQGLVSAVAILGIGNHTSPQTSLDNLSQRTPPHKSSSRHRLRTQATNVSNGSAEPSAHTEDVARRRHRSAHRSPSSLCQPPHVAPTTSYETLPGGYLIPSVLSEQNAAAAAVPAPSLQPAMHEGLEPDQGTPLTFPTPQQSTERQPLQHLSSLLLPTGPHSSSLEFAIDTASGSSGPGSHPQHTSSLPGSLPPQSSSTSHPSAGLPEARHKQARQGDAACSSLPQPHCPKSAVSATCQLHDSEAQCSPDGSGHPKAPMEPGRAGHCSIAACVVPDTSAAAEEGPHPAPVQPGSCEWAEFFQQTQQLVTRGPPEQQQQQQGHGLDGNSQRKVGTVCSKKAKEGWSRRVLRKVALALSRNTSWADKKFKGFKRAEAAALLSIAPTASDQAVVPVMNSSTQPPDGGQQQHLHQLEGHRDNSSQAAAPAATGPSLARSLPLPSPILTPTTATPFEDILASIVRQGTGELQVTSGFLTSLDGSVFASLSTVGQAQLAEIVHDNSGDLHSAMSDAVPDHSQSTLPTASQFQRSTGIELWQLPAPLHTSSRSQPHTSQAPAPHTPALQPSSLNASRSMPVSNTSSTRMLELFGLRLEVPASQEGLAQDAASSPSWPQLLYNSLMTPSGVLACGFSAALFSNGRTQPSEATAGPPAVACPRQLGKVDGSNHVGGAGTAAGTNPWLSSPGMSSLLYSNAGDPLLRHTHDGATHLREGTSDGAEQPGSPLSSQEGQDQLLSTDSIDMGVGAGSEGGLQDLTNQLAEWHENITIIFSDVVGFTDMAQQVHPQLVMTMLNDMYSRFDDLCLASGNAVYKVETIGDSLMVATGLMRKDPDHAATAVRFALLMRSAAHKVSLPTTGQPVQIRIGIHSGRAMSGIVGKLRRRFCLFGDTVNTASRMESTSGEPGAVHISNDTYLLVRHLEEYQFACRGSLNIKGKGLMTTCRLTKRQVATAMAKKKQKGGVKEKKGPPKKQKASRSPQGKQRQERRDGWNNRRRQVIRVPEGAVLRGCKKTRRKLRAHLQLRAKPASMECDSDSDSESDCDSEPEPQSDSEPAEPLKKFCKFFANPNFKTVYNQLQRRLVRPGQHRHPMLMPVFDDPSNQALLTKPLYLGSINLTGDANTIDAHSMQLAVAMQQHYSNPGKALDLYVKAARAQLGWSGEEAQLFIKMARRYGINAKSSELHAAHLDKGHVDDLMEEADKHRRLLGMKKQGSLQDTLPLPCRMRHAVHVCRWLEQWQQPPTPPVPGQPMRGKRRGVGPRTLTCPSPFTLTPMARVGVHFINVDSRVLHGIGVGIDPGVTQAVSAAFGVWDPESGQLVADRLAQWKLTKGQVYLDSKWARQRLRLYGAQDRALEQFLKKLEEDMAELSMKRHGRAKQLVVFFSAAGIGTAGGWGADEVLRACCKVVCRPRGAGQRRGRVVLVDEHRTTRVSSAVNGKQPCEEELNKLSATRPTGWKPPAGQVEQRLVRPAWSQQRDQPVRGLMWCPALGISQAATPAAASEPGPSNPPPAKRSKRTEAEQAAEPTQPSKDKGKGKGKAAKAKPAPQPGRWLDRDCNAALNMQRIGESKWRPLELCYWPDQGALPAKGKEYPGLGYKRLRDKPPKAQQEQQPAAAQ
ncbi:hypothetical protein QJQ45_009610 [Haematococcus lacustris]|nr:hypothetical protein QJQ45_009610 [Haematococcus lacustris]